jgi:epoxyqueuosine reductase
MVCPWNIRFAPESGDPAFEPRPGVQNPLLEEELKLTPQEFNKKFKNSPLKRAKRRGYLRNVAVAAGNSGKTELLPALEQAQKDDEALVHKHAQWAIKRIKNR